MAGKLFSLAIMALVSFAAAADDTDVKPGSVNCTKHEGGSLAALCPKNMRCIRSNLGYYGAQAQYACYNCASNCDCPVGQYCSTTNSNSTIYGTCQSYAKKLNTPCSADVKPSGSDWKAVGTNVDPDMTAMTNGSKYYCGLYETVDQGSTDGGSALTNQTVWTGVCIVGLCKECNSALMVGSVSQVSLSDYSGSTYSTFSGAQKSLDLYCAADASSAPSTLGYTKIYSGSTSYLTPDANSFLGPPRYCKNFAIIEAGSDIIGDMLSGGVFKNEMATYSLVAFVVAAMALVA